MTAAVAAPAPKRSQASAVSDWASEVAATATVATAVARVMTRYFPKRSPSGP